MESRKLERGCEVEEEGGCGGLERGRRVVVVVGGNGCVGGWWGVVWRRVECWEVGGEG